MAMLTTTKLYPVLGLADQDVANTLSADNNTLAGQVTSYAQINTSSGVDEEKDLTSVSVGSAKASKSGGAELKRYSRRAVLDDVGRGDDLAVSQAYVQPHVMKRTLESRRRAEYKQVGRLGDVVVKDGIGWTANGESHFGR